jgi:hypothetical protein
VREKVLGDGAHSMEIEDSEFFQDIFVTVENARIHGIRRGDMGDCQSVIVLKW